MSLDFLNWEIHDILLTRQFLTLHMHEQHGFPMLQVPESHM
jgi:hypothetical protein